MIESFSINCKQLAQIRTFSRLLPKKRTHLLCIKINKMIPCPGKSIKKIIQNLLSQDLLLKKVEENNLILTKKKMLIK